MLIWLMGSISEQSWREFFEQNAVQKSYAANQVIDFQGEASDSIGLVNFGTIEAVVFSENGDEVWIDEFTEGNFIGHMSFLEASIRQFELIAKSDVSVSRVSVKKMRELMDTNKPLREAFTTDFAERLDAMTNSLVGAYSLSAKGRICAELLRLSNEIGIDPDKHIIRPNPVYVELARRVNSTRETVSRTVSDLQKMGILSREPGALIVQKPQKLAAAFK